MATFNDYLQKGYTRAQILEAVGKKYGQSSSQFKSAMDKAKLYGNVKVVQNPPKPGSTTQTQRDFSPTGLQTQGGIFSPVSYAPMTEEERKSVYEREKAAKRPYFERKMGEAKYGQEKEMSDYQRLIGYAKSDTAKELASQNRTFARSLQSATDAYGKRGLLGSGIMAQAVTEAGTEFGRQQADTQETTDRNLGNYQRAIEESKRKYDIAARDFTESTESDILGKVNAEEANRRALAYYHAGQNDRSRISTYNFQ